MQESARCEEEINLNEEQNSIHVSDEEMEFEDNITDADSITESDDDNIQDEDDIDTRTEALRTGGIIMFPASGLSVGDVITMVAEHCLRYNISNEGRKSIMELLKICAGPVFHNINVSNYRFTKQFDPSDDKINYHFYCTSCNSKLYSTTKQQFAANKKLCESCKREHNISLLSKNMFVSIDLRYQIDLVLQDTNVRKALIQKMNARNIRREDGCITDISDGELYREIITKCPTSLAFNINTDGAPLFHTSKRSFWPLQLILNDLPPKMRFKYVLMAGVMIVEHKPTPRLMNVYLEELVQQIFRLREDGIDLGITIDNVQISCIPAMLCWSVDSVARAVI